MANWRDMGAGRELDQVIAVRLHPGKMVARRDDGDWYWMDTNYPIAYYSTDANAAISLITSMPGENGHLFLEYVARHRAWQAHVWHEYHVLADTAALAVCRAWLAYQEAQQRG